MDYLTLPIEEKIIFVWIKFIYFEFMEYKHIKGYRYLLEKAVNPMVSETQFRNYKKILELCKDIVSDIKIINGNQFHMNLFIELERMLKKVIS